ncbi:hypothetical protein ERO13_D06G026532v2 [Gossypium hirsutum]|nr:hypothetical protein ERO13_D06G026532v2 [Gossypium hirsutum]
MLAPHRPPSTVVVWRSDDNAMMGSCKPWQRKWKRGRGGKRLGLRDPFGTRPNGPCLHLTGHQVRWWYGGPMIMR